jgi:hypothetical protein
LHTGCSRDLACLQVVVEALAIEELVAGSMVDDAPLLEHGDGVGVADRAEPVRHDHRRAMLEDAVEVALDRGSRAPVASSKSSTGGSW